MASTTPQNNARELTSQLWAMANDLRAKMDASEYRDYILGFIFYRYLSKRQERNLIEKKKSQRQKGFLIMFRIKYRIQ